ncbi:MAG: ABC transporter substrate-binding protein [Burkholderiales bacterium]
MRVALPASAPISGQNNYLTYRVDFTFGGTLNGSSRFHNRNSLRTEESIKMTRRRTILKLLGVAVLARPFAGRAQPAQKLRRIGYLSAGQSASPGSQRGIQQLRDSLRRKGYDEGGNLAIERRFAEGNAERLPALAEELLGQKVELIVAVLNPAIAAAKRATRTVPIVMHVGASPVENGYVETLARPGGNITGTVWSGPESAGKILQILKEAKPGAVRVATLWNSTFPAADAWKRESDRAASALGVSVQYFDVTRTEELVVALDRIAATRPDALVAWGDHINIPRAREVAAFAVERKIVLISNSPRHTEEGGLISYAPDLSALYDRTASFVDRILRGTTPANLPVEQPTTFDLIVNAKTARAIRHTIPSPLLLQATRVIE